MTTESNSFIDVEGNLVRRMDKANETGMIRGSVCRKSYRVLVDSLNNRGLKRIDFKAYVSDVFASLKWSHS